MAEVPERELKNPFPANIAMAILHRPALSINGFHPEARDRLACDKMGSLSVGTLCLSVCLSAPLYLSLCLSALLAVV